MKKYLLQMFVEDDAGSLQRTKFAIYSLERLAEEMEELHKEHRTGGKLFGSKRQERLEQGKPVKYLLEDYIVFIDPLDN